MNVENEDLISFKASQLVRRDFLITKLDNQRTIKPDKKGSPPMDIKGFLKAKRLITNRTKVRKKDASRIISRFPNCVTF